MTERKSLSKKTRFEVFKRDSFTCQYCGSKAPDVILEIDHIQPVKDGGTNDIMNLVTSCFACNRGKSARKIKDGSVIEKQRAQIEELNIRRQQLEMMLQWRDGINQIKTDSHNKTIDYWNKKWEVYKLNVNAEKELSILVDKFGLINVLDAIDVAVDKYGKEQDAKAFNIAFKKLGGILYLKTKPEYKQKIAYIKGICRNKFAYFDEKTASILIEKYYQDGYDLGVLEASILSGELNNWTSLKYYLQ